MKTVTSFMDYHSLDDLYRSSDLGHPVYQALCAVIPLRFFHIHLYGMSGLLGMTYVHMYLSIVLYCM